MKDIPMKEIMCKLLLEALWPDYLYVRNDSQLHKGHRGTDKTEDSHFAVTIVSDSFNQTSLPQRHRQVYRILNSLIEGGIHALQIQAYTRDEWNKKSEAVHGE